MKFKLFLFVSLYFGVLTWIQAQNLKINWSIGMAEFSMNELKKFNDSYAKMFDFDARVVDNFPSNYYNTVSFLQKIHQNIYFGLEYSNASTGSRIHYKDYSGVYYNDYILKSNSFGFLSEFKIISFKRFFLNGNIGFSIISSKMKTHENCSLLSNEIWDSKDTYKSDEVALSFGLSPWYQINNYLAIGLNCSYIKSSSGKIHLYGKMDDVYPGTMGFSSSLFKTNWSGLRYGLLISIIL